MTCKSRRLETAALNFSALLKPGGLGALDREAT